MHNENYITIKQAAQALEVSPDTIRRRIKKGEIQAEKFNGEYGYAWYIPESEITKAREVVDVVPVNRSLSREQIKGVIKEAVSEEMQELKNQIEDLRRQLEENKMIEQPRKPWWKRLFKK